MRKLFSIFAFALLFVGITFGQAAVDIPITVTDNAGGSKVLNFGLDLTATIGIDPLLGESDLPPFPPVGVFEARFDLNPFPGGTGLSTYQDYRNAPAFPFSGTVEHRFIGQFTTGATAFTIAYNLPSEATMQIQDIITGTLVNSGPLSGSGSFEIGLSLTNARITIVYTGIGSVLGPVFAVAPASLSFGQVNVGSSSIVTVTVCNTGDCSIKHYGSCFIEPRIYICTICTGYNSSRRKSGIFNVTFTPAAAGLVNANLTFTHDAPGSPTSYAVSGTGYVPAPVFGNSSGIIKFRFCKCWFKCKLKCNGK